MASSSGLTAPAIRSTMRPFTKQSCRRCWKRLGVNIRGQQIRTGNVAAVMVTADLPPFATQGTRIDVTASAMGDAKRPPRRYASGHAASGRRWQRSMRSPKAPCPSGGFQAQGQGASIHPRRADRRTATQRRHHRARGRVRAQQRRTIAACFCAMPTSPRQNASPRRSTTTSARPSLNRSDPFDRADHTSEKISRKTSCSY